MSRQRRCLWLITAVFAALLGVCAFFDPKVWFVRPQEKYYRAFWSEHRKICGRESLVDFLTFDEPSLPEFSDGRCKKDWYGITDAVGSRVSKVPGRHGKGIRFDGDNDTFYALGRSWLRLPEAFSIAFWMNLKPMPSSQDIFCAWDPGCIGFWLDRGCLRFDWPVRGKPESVSYAFDKYGEFVHIAIVANRKRGTIRLYENGICMAEGDCSDMTSFRWQFTLGRGNFARSRNPLHGTIDDLAIWNRDISESELRDIVQSRYGLQEHFLSPRKRFSLARKRFRADVMKRLGGLFRSPGIARALRWRLVDGKTPQIRIYMRDPSLRSLARAHARSMKSSCLAAKNEAEAFVTISGQTTECRVSLAGGRAYYPYTDRMAYELEPLERNAVFPNGYRRIELLPPEKSGWLVPVAVSEIRRQCGLGRALRNDSDLVNLEVNGLRRGTYVMCDASHMRVSHDISSDVLGYSGSRQPFIQRDAEMAHYSPTAIDAATSNLVSMLSAESREAVRRKLAASSAVLATDCRSPVPSAFRALALREQADAFDRMLNVPRVRGVADVIVEPAMFIGANENAWCVTDDMDVSSFAESLPSGITVDFASSDTNVLSSAGKVVRPPERPELVTLTATLTDSSGSVRSVPLEFRVLPLANAVPAVFVWTPVPFGRTHRTEAAIELVDFCGTNGVKRDYSGQAGVRYRGNTSFLRPKKLLNINADTPHRWLGDTDTTHLLAINAVTDILRVWNSLAYDLFRDFPRADGGANIAPHVKVAELFVNGKYWSLIEFAERLDEHLWGDGEYVAFRHRIAAPRYPFMRQARPSASKSDALDVYLDFEKSLDDFDGSAEALERIKSQLDITSVVDYMLLFSLFANINGENGDFWMQECLVYDPASKRFFYVPWDFDVVLLRRMNLIETKLNRMLSASDPEYDEFVLRRWRELRRTVLSTDSVLARYDAIVSGHAEYLPFEYRAWYPEMKEWSDVKSLIRTGRANIAFRLEKVDRLLAERCEQTASRAEVGR